MKLEFSEKLFTFEVNDKNVTAMLNHDCKEFHWNGIYKNIEVIDVSSSEELSKEVSYAAARKCPPRVFLGPKYFQFPDEQQSFILLHEVGHLFLDHNDKIRILEQEVEADNFALSMTKNAVAAIENLRNLIEKNVIKDPEEIKMRIQNIYSFNDNYND